MKRGPAARSGRGAGSGNAVAGRGRLERLLPAAVLVLAALLRLWYLLLYAREIPFWSAPVVDAKIYDLWARKIASGDWLSRGEGAFYRAPLYPYFLAIVDKLTGGPVPWTPILQAFMGVGTIFLAGRIARRMAGPKAAFWTMLLLLLYGPLTASDSKLLATTLGLFLQMGALWLSLRAWERPRPLRALAAGVVFGLGCLVRPQWLPLAFAVPVALEIGRGEARAALRRWMPYAVGIAVVILPVTVRNLAIGHDLVLISSNGGMTFYQGNNEENRSGLLTIVTKFELFGSATEQRTLETRVAERETGRPLRPSETSAFWTGQALRFITRQPGAWLVLEGRKLYRYVTSYEYADNYSYYLERERLLPLRLAFLPFGALLALGVLGACLGPSRGFRGEPGAGRLALIAAAYGAAGCLAFYVSARYRMESAPALAILGGAALARLPGLRALPRRRVAACGGAAALVFAASFLPAGLPARSQESITYLQLGNALETRQRFREAETAYRQSIRNLPVNVFAWDTLVLLVSRLHGPAAADSLLATAPREMVQDHPLSRYTRGTLRARMERDDEAMAEFRAAVRGNPLMREAHAGLALLLEKRRSYEEAASELEEALRLGPDDPDLLAHLLYVRIQLRRYPEARDAAQRFLKVRPGDADANLNLAIADFYLGRLEEARAALEELRGRERGREDPLVLYYLGLIELRSATAPGSSGADPAGRSRAAERLEAAYAAGPENRRALYYAALARGGADPEPAPRDSASAGLPRARGSSWAGTYGPEIGPALPALRDFLRARAATPWGADLDPAQQMQLSRLERAPEGSTVAADIRRFLAEERTPATIPK